MQTFLPSSSFLYSARILDNVRLNKQIVESEQIFRACLGKTIGWKNHTATRMWRGCEWLLREYGLECYREWRRRLRKGLRGGVLFHKSGFRLLRAKVEIAGWPEWLGDERLHRSHRAALLFKDYEYYSQFDWNEEPLIDYYWPN